MRQLASLLVAVVIASAGSIAHAAPLEANRQASNNAVEIAYDDVTSAIEVVTETSAIRIPEKIRMWVTVASDAAAEPGSRLLGELRLYLRGKQAMSFDGIFKIVFLDSLNGGRTSFEAEDAFVLRPRAGQRSHHIDLVFDLPSGTYLYFGRYKPH